MIKNNIIEAYISYRLPNSKSCLSFKGKIEQLNSVAEIGSKTGFIFHAFNSNENILISDLEKCELNEFQFYYSNESPFIINQSSYIRECNQIINLLEDNRFTKVIYSRIAREGYSQDPVKIFNQLNELSNNSFNYLISIKGTGVWMGATPEKLASIKNQNISTTSIAGTKKESKFSWGDKEIEEQNIVTQFINEILERNECTNISTIGPTDINTGVVLHLKTDFTANIEFNKWKKVVSELHPTPATCGLPQKDTLNFIQDFEKHKRSYYTGFLGTIGKNEINLYVNLRCMSLTKDNAYLYLGGGITKDSNAEDEWDETENKAQTLLRVLN